HKSDGHSRVLASIDPFLVSCRRLGVVRRPFRLSRAPSDRAKARVVARSNFNFLALSNHPLSATASTPPRSTRRYVTYTHKPAAIGNSITAARTGDSVEPGGGADGGRPRVTSPDTLRGGGLGQTCCRFTRCRYGQLEGMAPSHDSHRTDTSQ